MQCIGETTMPNAQFIEVLAQLGLTTTEAKVFWVLSSVGAMTARMISENAGIAREVVYQIMPPLQEKGLVEAVLTVPQTYRAIEAEDAFHTLLSQNRESQRKLQRSANECIRVLKKAQVNPASGYPQIAILPQGKALSSRMTNEIRSARKSVDAIVSRQKLQKWYSLYVAEEIREAKKRNLKLQIIVGDRSAVNFTQLVESLSSMPNSEYLNLRVAPTAALTNMVIIDDTNLFVDVSLDNELAKSPFLYSNNPGLLPLATSYFQINWEKAIPLRRAE